MSVTSTKFGLCGATARYSGLLLLLLLLLVFFLVKLALLRLFVQIAYAIFTQEHLRAAVGGSEAEGVFVVVAHETAHLFAGVEYDDDRDPGGHQLFHVPGFHAGALDGRRRSFIHDFFFVGLRPPLNIGIKTPVY